MSEDKTKEINGSKSFEERVFARFDALDLRLDRVEARLDRVDARLDRMEARVSLVEERLGEMDARFQQRFSSVEHNLAAVDTRLENIEAKQYDTKPIWEKVLSELGSLKEQIENLGRKFEVLSKDMVQLRADLLLVHNRLDRLESQNA